MTLNSANARSRAVWEGCAIFLAVVTLAPCAQSQDLPTVRLTLEQAIQQGVAASQRLAEMRATEQAAAATVASRHAADRPIVGAQAGYTRTNHVDEFAIAIPGQPPRIVYPDIPDNYHTRLDLQWPIYTGARARCASGSLGGGRGRGCGAGRSAARDHARVLGAGNG
jgi:outer membrane protein TolC